MRNSANQMLFIRSTLGLDDLYHNIFLNFGRYDIRTPTMDVCTYKCLKNEFAKYLIPPPIKLYSILEIKMVEIN